MMLLFVMDFARQSGNLQVVPTIFNEATIPLEISKCEDFWCTTSYINTKLLQYKT